MSFYRRISVFWDISIFYYVFFLYVFLLCIFSSTGFSIELYLFLRKYVFFFGNSFFFNGKYRFTRKIGIIPGKYIFILHNYVLLMEICLFLCKYICFHVNRSFSSKIGFFFCVNNFFQ